MRGCFGEAIGLDGEEFERLARPPLGDRCDDGFESSTAIGQAVAGTGIVPIAGDEAVNSVTEGQDVEIARFLEEGADDYMVKPFSHIEFMGRIQAICRRAQGRMQSIAPAVKAEDLLMDFGASEVYKANEPVALTRTEMSLLQYLVRNATRVVTYESLANVLQIAKDGDNRLIKVHIQHLRSKLGDSADNPRYIANVYALGYKFLPKVSPVVTQALVSPL